MAKCIAKMAVHVYRVQQNRKPAFPGLSQCNAFSISVSGTPCPLAIFAISLLVFCCSRNIAGIFKTAKMIAIDKTGPKTWVVVIAPPIV